MLGDSAASGPLKAAELAGELAEQGLDCVALSFVDNTGVSRSKSIPVTRLEHAAAWGIGMSPCFDVFLSDDTMTAGKYSGGPDGDLRLVPDLAALVPLAAQPGWAWAPVDRFTQDGEAYPGCQRSFARRMAGEARRQGLEFSMSFEVEWVLGHPTSDGSFAPAAGGPAYGMSRLTGLSGFARDLLAALTAEGVPVEQFHPEYAAGQCEVSVGPADPVAAADTNVLVRQTIRAVAARHQLRPSFAPAVVPAAVGNGSHVHVSAWRDGQNVFAGGDGPYGMTREGEGLMAGWLAHLPALTAIGAPSPASYLRLAPSRWAGAFACWGRETRETAIRFVTGMRGSESRAANTEIKSFDASANPYLVTGALIAVGLHGAADGLRLPAEITGDPATRTEQELARLGVRRLPGSLPEATASLEHDEVLQQAMGEVLADAFLAVRRAEAALAADRTADQIADATRWLH